MPDAPSTPHIAALCAALPALRLNHSFPPWRPIQAHLAALQLPVPGHPLIQAPDTAWPHPDAWLRVRVDGALADELLPVLRPLAAGGDARAKARVAYLEAIRTVVPLEEAVWQVRLIGHDTTHLRVEITLDQHILAAPILRRTTLRIATVQGGPITEQGHTLVLDPELERRIAEAAAAPARGVLRLSEWGEVESLTVGEVGPARNGLRGPWLSAVLTRVSESLDRTWVDDALLDSASGDALVELPRPDRPERLSRQRKWAVPRADVSAVRGWLAQRGSRNLHYTYRLPRDTP